MRCPSRKPGKFTNLKIDQHLTQKKLDEFKAKLARLKNKRPLVAEEVKRLALMGDFSENVSYQIEKGRLRGINQGIIEIEDLLKRAVIIEPQKNISTVQLGHKVAIESNGKQKTYQILGSSETDPLKGIISHNSPIGKGLLGRRVGDIVEIQLGNKNVKYEIITIE